MTKDIPEMHKTSGKTNADDDYANIAKVSILIDAPRTHIWEALVKPALIKKYMLGTTVVSDWKKGSPIIWKGEWDGKPYEDRGIILDIKPEKVLQYSHFSPLSGLPDAPENHHIVTIALTKRGNKTELSLAQENNKDEETRQHSEENWKMILDNLKKLLEKERENIRS